jgi:hypothetical protein
MEEICSLPRGDAEDLNIDCDVAHVDKNVGGRIPVPNSTFMLVVTSVQELSLYVKTVPATAFASGQLGGRRLVKSDGEESQKQMIQNGTLVGEPSLGQH